MLIIMQKKPTVNLNRKIRVAFKQRTQIKPLRTLLGGLGYSDKENSKSSNEIMVRKDTESTSKIFFPSVQKYRNLQKVSMNTPRGRVNLDNKTGSHIVTIPSTIKKVSQNGFNLTQNGLGADKKRDSNQPEGSGSTFTPKSRLTELKKRPQQFLYYITDIKRQINNALLGSDEPNIPMAHFFQSIATCHIFNKVRVPRQPHISVTLPALCPTKRHKTTLIFDMDETLLHCSEGHADDENAVPLQMESNLNQTTRYFLKCNIRPHAREVLSRLAQKYEIGVFTAGRQSYATAMLNFLDPNNQYFGFRLFRQHCHQYYHNEGPDPLNVKDLRIIKNRDIRKMILIDNSAHTYLFQPQNAIPIFSYYEDKDDRQLLKLQNFLQQNFQSCPKDIRPALREYFRVQQYKKFKSANEICNKLY